MFYLWYSIERCDTVEQVKVRIVEEELMKSVAKQI